MLKGVHLTLMMGKVVARRVSREVIEALESIQVTTSAGQRSGFQLTFTISKKPALNEFLLLLAAIGPFARVIITVTMKGNATVLMDGTITNQQMSPDSNAGKSTVTITGEDLTAIMDLIEFTGIPYPAVPEAGRVALMIAKYAAYGIVPVVVPPLFPDLTIPIEKFSVHQGTDLNYINLLASAAGYVFYIDPGPLPGTNKAYFGPEIKVGVPQPALNVNMDAHTNVESLSFTHDGLSKTLPIVVVHIKETKTPIAIPIPDITPLNPPLGAIPAFPAKVTIMKETGKYSIPRAIAEGISLASRSADAVSASGKLDVVRYGRILKARQLVGVRGAGKAFDGLYYVKSVTHELKRGEYKQSFNLSRNGLVSTLAKVPA